MLGGISQWIQGAKDVAWNEVMPIVSALCSKANAALDEAFANYKTATAAVKAQKQVVGDALSNMPFGVGKDEVIAELSRQYDDILQREADLSRYLNDLTLLNKTLANIRQGNISFALYGNTDLVANISLQSDLGQRAMSGLGDPIVVSVMIIVTVIAISTAATLITKWVTQRSRVLADLAATNPEIATALARAETAGPSLTSSLMPLVLIGGLIWLAPTLLAHFGKKKT